MYLDKNRYAIRGDASFSTYTSKPNKSALLAQRDGGGHVAHANGGDVEKERLCMLQKQYTQHTRPRALVSGLACLHLTAATTCLGWRADLVVASVAQPTDLRAGLWMGPSSHRTDLWAEAASRDEVVVTSVLAAVYHALKSTAEQRLCAIGASRWPLVVTVGVVGAGATSGTLRPGPGGPPGPAGGSRGQIPAQPEFRLAGLTPIGVSTLNPTPC